MAVASRNLGRRQDAEEHIKEAIAHLDCVTERERHRMRGFAFSLTGHSWQVRSTRAESSLLQRYRLTVARQHNNLVIGAVLLRKFRAASRAWRQALAVLPRSVRQRWNLSVLLACSSDFQNAEREAQEVQKLAQASLARRSHLRSRTLARSDRRRRSDPNGARKQVSPSDAAAGSG